MFQLLTGETVHDAHTKNEAIVAAATRQARSIASVRPRTTPALAAIVDRALAFEPSARWPNARAMEAALTGLVQAGDEIAPAPELSTLPERPSSRRRVAVRTKAMSAAILSVALAVVAGIGRAQRHSLPTQTARSAPVYRSMTSALPLAVTVRATPEPKPSAVDAGGAPMMKKRLPRRSPHPLASSPALAASVQTPMERSSNWQVDEVLDRRK